LTQRYDLLVLLGPTAVGKTAYSIPIALAHDAEIISGDSMQVYRGMDIGTAKPSPEDRARVPHHLIDIVDPWEPFSVADFQARAREAVERIAVRGRLPMLVGGTGLYIEAFCYDYRFPETAGPDPALRERLRREAAELGVKALHDRLKRIDPDSAARIHENDVRRIVRALEIFEATGRTMSEWLRGQKRESPYRLCLIGLTMDRAELYRRIGERVDAMVRAGLVDEVRRLLDAGCTPDMTAMQALGYKEIVEYLEGRTSFEEAVETLKRNTRRFAKRQWSWFRHMKDVHWIDVTDPKHFADHLDQIHAIISEKLGRRGRSHER